VAKAKSSEDSQAALKKTIADKQAVIAELEAQIVVKNAEIDEAKV
jgi:hypothetical protein